MVLKEKVVIVSGGSRGIGRSIVLGLAEKGAKVAFTYNKSTTETEEILREAEKLSGTVMAYQVDIRNQLEVKNLVSDVIKLWGTVDVLVNNAGIRKDKTLAFMATEDWDDVLQTNLNGTYYLTQASIFYMLKKRKGRVINISSISGINGISGQTNYSSSKAAIIGFTRSLAKEVAPYGVSVNAIAPGGVDTEMVQGLSDKDKEKLLLGVPIGRLCTAEEVAKVTLFLANEDLCPDYLTGSVITLDGGLGS